MRALVIDDNADSVAMLEMVLRLAGHEARGACDGKSALALAESFAPDVVFLDLSLPDVDGFHVARSLRATPGGERCLLIAVTGWSDAETRARVRETGIDQLLVKPFDCLAIEEIMQRVEARR